MQKNIVFAFTAIFMSIGFSLAHVSAAAAKPANFECTGWLYGSDERTIGSIDDANPSQEFHLGDDHHVVLRLTSKKSLLISFYIGRKNVSNIEMKQSQFQSTMATGGVGLSCNSR